MITFTQADIDSLKASIARGVLTVESDGDRVTYSSLGQMMSLLSFMEATVIGGSGGRIGMVYVVPSRD